MKEVNRVSGSTTRAAGASTPSSTPLRWDRQPIQFSVNAWVLVVAVLAMFPLVPKSLSNRAYRLSFMGTACSSLYSLYSLYGKPRAWNLQEMQMWLQSVIATKDFIYFIYCLTFVTSNLRRARRKKAMPRVPKGSALTPFSYSRRRLGPFMVPLLFVQLLEV